MLYFGNLKKRQKRENVNKVVSSSMMGLNVTIKNSGNIPFEDIDTRLHILITIFKVSYPTNEKSTWHDAGCFFLLFQLHFSFFSYTPAMKGIEASASNLPFRKRKQTRRDKHEKEDCLNTGL